MKGRNCTFKRGLAIPGITVNGSNSLTIWAQSHGTDAGALVVDYVDDIYYESVHGESAGIGGYGRNEGEMACGTIEINGGRISSRTDGLGTGIGSAYNYQGEGGNITINAGTVDAYGGEMAPGIGSALGNCENITITGGTVNAYGGIYAAGIGTGYQGNGGVITITGGHVYAESNPDDGSTSWSEWDRGAGIGIGNIRGMESKIEINLSYESVDSDMSVTANSYYGIMRLEKDFVDQADGTLFRATEKVNPNVMEMMAGRTLVPGTIEEIIPVTLNGVTGSFNDKIKLNFYFDIPQNVYADEDIKVTITNEETGESSTADAKDAEYVAGRGYKFSIPLVPKRAGDTVSVKLVDSNENILPIRDQHDNLYENSFQTNLMNYLNWMENNGDEKEKALATAAKDYCIAAQIYFKYKADGLKVSSAVNAVTEQMLSQYVAVRGDDDPPGAVFIKGITAMLESDNTFRLYVGFDRVDPRNYRYKIDGQEARLKQRADGQYYLALDEGAYSNHLQDTHTYVVSDYYGYNKYTITASVLTYARSCAKKKTEADRNLGKALYLYNRAAVAAFGE